MAEKPFIVIVAGPTASGKSAKAIELAQARNGEVISVDSRQVYRRLDIGTEKLTQDEMQGVPHHLIDIKDPAETYSAGDFVQDASAAIEDIRSRGNLPILAGGSHFYFDALLYGLPGIEADEAYRTTLEGYSDEHLFEMVREADPRRAEELDPQNRRRLIRALEIIHTHGSVPERLQTEPAYSVEWHIINPEKEILRERIDLRLGTAFERGLIEEVRRIREEVGDARLNELGLEYRVVGEFLREERSESSLVPALSSKLWHYARRQKAWLRKLEGLTEG